MGPCAAIMTPVMWAQMALMGRLLFADQIIGKMPESA